MNKRIQMLAVLAAVMTTLTFGYGQDKSRETIDRVALAFQDAWNRHDIRSLAALMADDVDFITVGGSWQKGRKEFEEKHTKSHDIQFKESVLTINNTEVKFVRPNVAVAHVEWSMKGDKDLDGTPRQPRQGILTWVLEKRKGKWLIIASQNTNIKVPVPGK